MAEPWVSDELWRKLEPLLPQPRRKDRHVQFAGRKRTDPRRIFSGIVFVLRTGVPWRALPATGAFPSGYTCRLWLLRWHRAGVWKRLSQLLLAELRSKGRLHWTHAVVDSSSVRAPSGGRKTGPSPVDRRKLGTKHHFITDAMGTPLAVTLTGANRNDITQLLPLVDELPRVRGKRGSPKQKPQKLYADRGYDSDSHRLQLKKRHIEPYIARRRTAHGSGLGRKRSVVERTLSWLHQFRKLEIREEHSVATYKALADLALCLIYERLLES
ncbi:IS5-like element ISStau10 family transposase [Stigmatella aurantiaca]|uniref:Isjp4 transposase n=1 Tax=Stigmatella aurantiaca (strain DW4/3-1) TaxID=378806 RepID=Q08VM8_STIAD|nr:IS5-like element ISStau10 family transposase [Stigmatella aurantiaca]ADO73721.1 Transposase, IS4-like protein [Stigmatella aurantiaca DW4/3-1]EAU64531.1 isjp4 transposase [Stigmatella aurantiaca DW4/3-1]